MKMTLTNQILFVVLGVCLIAAMIFCVQTVSINGDLRNYNGQVTAINSWWATVQALEVDLVEYSKSNPAILPILREAKIINDKAPAPAPKPATK